MGSLPSPPRPTTLPPSPEDSISNFRVYAAFGCRKQVPNANISNWIECYNPSNNTWSHVTSIPDLIDNHVMKGFAMVSLGDNLYNWWEAMPQRESSWVRGFWWFCRHGYWSPIFGIVLQCSVQPMVPMCTTKPATLWFCLHRLWQ